MKDQKLAMIQIQDWLQKEKLGTLMIMQVHDELVFDVPSDEVDIVVQKVKELMQGVGLQHDLAVPLLVEHGIGENWLQAH